MGLSLEKTIQEKTIKYLNSIPRCTAENVSGNALQKGRADVNGCWEGKCFRIELKSRDNRNKPSLAQKLNLKRWAKAGAMCFVAYSIDDVKAVINKEKVYYKDKFTGEWYSPEPTCN